MGAPNHRLVITIDGPAGAGKSTTAKLLASRLGYTYLDTGALYRAVAWHLQETGIDMTNDMELRNLLQVTDIRLTVQDGETNVFVNGQDVTRFLRSPTISSLASSVAILPTIRGWLLPLQQKFGNEGGIVAEGRDMGTRVFPHADVKFFLDANLEIRANRRFHDEVKTGHDVNRQEVIQEVKSRDDRDRSRDIAPLKPASDAVVIDSSNLTIEQVVDAMMEMIPAQS